MCLHQYSILTSRAQLRYILEAALFEADVTNRTLILPSFVYARACTVEQSVLIILPLATLPQAVK